MSLEILWGGTAAGTPWDQTVECPKDSSAGLVGHRAPFHKEVLINEQKSIYLVLGLSVWGKVALQHGFLTKIAVP